jgi:hypothetical protein
MIILPNSVYLLITMILIKSHTYDHTFVNLIINDRIQILLYLSLGKINLTN